MSPIQYTYPAQYRWEKPNGASVEVDAAEQAQAALWGDKKDGGDAFLEELVDIINPLQQLPGVGVAYREMTQDAISPFARMVGGFLFGGPIGFAVAAVNSVIEAGTGADIGEHLVAMFTEESPVQVAQAAGAYSKAAELG